MRPTIKYASSIWSPLASPTNYTKLSIKNFSRMHTGTNTQHTHHETNIIPQKPTQTTRITDQTKKQHPSHPQHKLAINKPTPVLRNKSHSITQDTQQTSINLGHRYRTRYNRQPHNKTHTIVTKHLTTHNK